MLTKILRYSKAILIRFSTFLKVKKQYKYKDVYRYFLFVIKLIM